MTLGSIIKEYRTSHEMSMDVFSERSGISKAYISLLEKNKHPKTGKEIAPSIQCIKQAADAMDMDFNDLFNMLDGDVALESPISSDDSLESPKAKKRAAKRLDKALNMTGISAADLSHASEVSKSSISQYLSGSHIPSEENATKMGSVLNVNPLWLMGFDAPMTASSTAEHDERLACIIDYYQLLNDVGRDTAVARMRELTQIHDYVSQPDAYQVHADAIRQVNAIEESRSKKSRKTIS